VRSFTRRPNHPGLEFLPEDGTNDYGLGSLSVFVNATSLTHILDYGGHIDQTTVDILHGLSILTEQNQSAMLSITVLTMTLNIFGMCFSMEHVPDECETGEIRENVEYIVRVQAVLMPIMALAYTLLRVYLLKAQVARPVAKCFNLKKSSGYTYYVLGLLFVFIIASLCAILYFLEYEPVSHTTYWASGLSLFACLCAGLVVLLYSFHCNGLVQKVMSTFVHSINTQSADAV
jgi:hypothetical protein